MKSLLVTIRAVLDGGTCCSTLKVGQEQQQGVERKGPQSTLEKCNECGLRKFYAFAQFGVGDIEWISSCQDAPGLFTLSKIDPYIDPSSGARSQWLSNHGLS